MLVPIRWLRDYVDVDIPARQIAGRLNDSGVEVAGVTEIGGSWDPERIFVGRIVRIDPHPNADRLTLPLVDYGRGQMQVVCGARNIKEGDLVPFALAGAMLVDPYAEGGGLKTLEPARIRGFESRGMVCSSRELGISDEHEGILILPPDAPVGTPLTEYLGDEIIDLDLKPNRADCLALVGVARQVAGLMRKTLREPELGAPRDARSVLPKLALEIEDPALCARYSAAYLHDVRIGPSPEWIRRRLEAAGMRSINNIVDITNFVMLETGQPLHAFDWARLNGNYVGVRTAREGERLTTLDGQDRQLDRSNLLIVDGSGAVALAGVMGGLETEVGDSTHEILLESANFNQTSIRRTSRGLGLRSEASLRFEQRLSPETTVWALRRAVHLAEQTGAGKGVDLWEDAYPRPAEASIVDFPLGEIPRLLGVRYPEGEVVESLERIGFGVEKRGAGSLLVSMPFWRGDVTMAADLVEEVASQIGYDTVPSSLPSGGVMEAVPGEIDPREDLVKDILAAAGYQEAITYTLTSAERMGGLLAGAASGQETDELGAMVSAQLIPLHLNPIEVVNPLRSDENVVRLTPLAPLLETLASNLRFAETDVALFELGKAYLPREGDLPEERRMLAVVTGRRRSNPGWNERREVGLFDLKGVADLVLRRLGCPEAAYSPFVHPTFEPGVCAAVTAGDVLLGAVGKVSPSVCAAFEVGEAAWALLLDLERVFELAGGPRRFKPLPRFPSVVQDISIVIDMAARSSELVEAILGAGEGLAVDVGLLDEYRGEQVPKGKRGLTYSITYRSPDRTLVDEEVARVHARIVSALEKKFGATLRS